MQGARHTPVETGVAAGLSFMLPKDRSRGRAVVQVRKPWPFAMVPYLQSRATPCGVLPSLLMNAKGHVVFELVNDYHRVVLHPLQLAVMVVLHPSWLMSERWTWCQTSAPDRNRGDFEPNIHTQRPFFHLQPEGIHGVECAMVPSG